MLQKVLIAFTRVAHGRLLLHLPHPPARACRRERAGGSMIDTQARTAISQIIAALVTAGIIS